MGREEGATPIPDRRRDIGCGMDRQATEDATDTTNVPEGGGVGTPSPTISPTSTTGSSPTSTPDLTATSVHPRHDYQPDEVTVVKGTVGGFHGPALGSQLGLSGPRYWGSGFSATVQSIATAGDRRCSYILSVAVSIAPNI